MAVAVPLGAYVRRYVPWLGWIRTPFPLTRALPLRRVRGPPTHRASCKIQITCLT
jgi:hypothetical protein